MRLGLFGQRRRLAHLDVSMGTAKWLNTAVMSSWTLCIVRSFLPFFILSSYLSNTQWETCGLHSMLLRRLTRPQGQQRAGRWKLAYAGHCASSWRFFVPGASLVPHAGHCSKRGHECRLNLTTKVIPVGSSRMKLNCIARMQVWLFDRDNRCE